jgi:hypothetical protein
MFFEPLHCDGRLASEETPLPSGPRHCSQFLGAASVKQDMKITTAIKRVVEVKNGSACMRIIVLLPVKRLAQLFPGGFDGQFASQKIERVLVKILRADSVFPIREELNLELLLE